MLLYFLRLGTLGMVFVIPLLRFFRQRETRIRM